MKKSIQTLVFLLLVFLGRAQNYTPVTVTGFNHDAVAESYPNSQAVTDTVLDGSAYVVYSQAFAAMGSFQGGLPNNGLITDGSGTRQFQLQSYTGNNILNVMRNATKTFSLPTPEGYHSLSLLAFSTEGGSVVNITLDFTDGTTAVFSNISIPDWFAATTNVAISGFGRVTRTSNVTAVNGPPTNPGMVYIDLTLACADRKKRLQAIHMTNITTTGANAPYPNAVFLAVSGRTDTQEINTSATPASCGVNNGTATINLTGNSGPYTISWNTTPAQTTPFINNLASGTYTVSVTDGNGCVTNTDVVVAQLVSPSTITATATPAVLCSGESTTLSVAATGGTLTDHAWTPGGSTASSFTASPTVTTTYTVLGFDNAGCPYSRQVTVVVNQTPSAPVVNDLAICVGDPQVLHVQNPQPGFTYNWYTSPSGGSPVFSGPDYTVPAAGNSTFYVSASGNGCVSSARTTVSASILPAPVFNAGPDLTIVAGDVVQLNATASGGTYVWSPSAGLSSTTILNPMANPSVTTSYILTVTHPQGCAKSDTMTLTVLPYCIKPMEAFTPNGDGINDVWKITDGNCLAHAKVSVFNRYGNQVYQSDDYKNNWDGRFNGKALPDGTYYFVINYQLVGARRVIMKGTVTILR